MMKHIFHKGSDPTAPTLLLLHGTGGSEHDLLPLGGRICFRFYFRRSWERTGERDAEVFSETG